VQYGLINWTIGENVFLKLTPAKYEQLNTANKGLWEALQIEEKFNLVIENYAEFERELLTQANDLVIFSNISWSDLQTDKHAINRRLVNLLTTCRLYIDQVPHNMNLVYGKGSAQSSDTKKQMSVEFDGNVEYQIMEQLRNHVQHRDIPIYGIAKNRWLEDYKTDNSKFKFCVEPKLSVSSIREGGCFKPAILKKLEALGEEVDVRPLVRKYITCIYNIQKSIRKQMKDDIKNWADLIIESEKRYLAKQKIAPGLAVVQRTNVQKSTFLFHVSQNVINRYKWFMDRNNSFSNFTKSIVTNEVKIK